MNPDPVLTGSESGSGLFSDPNPDPVQIGPDPQHCFKLVRRLKNDIPDWGEVHVHVLDTHFLTLNEPLGFNFRLDL
jgi:hypothetical protein